MAEKEVAEPRELNNEEIERLTAPHDQCVAYFERQLIDAMAMGLTQADRSAVMNVFWCLLSLVEEHPSPPLLQIIRRASADLDMQRTTAHPENLGTLTARRLNALDVVHAFCGLKYSAKLLSTLAGMEGCFGADESFNALGATVDLAPLFAAYDPEPQGKPGKRGAESILAELCWLCEGLGFKRGDEESREDGIERIRRALDKAWREFESGARDQLKAKVSEPPEKSTRKNPASKRL